MTYNRRTFLGTVAGLGGAALTTDALAAALPVKGQLHVASNQYPWSTFYRRQGRDWTADLDASLKEFAQSGIIGYEPSVAAPDELKALGPLLKKYQLEMRSLYVNSTLHIAEEADKSVSQVLAIAEAAKPLGVKIIVTNPSPIKWGGPENKTDAQLQSQATALNRLGAELRKRDIFLAYHTHDIEMRHAAREFHHMLNATDPRNVSMCLDAHWVFRGSGDSQVALFDILKLYGKRIVELHLRQSRNGVWTEAFGEGDIDYRRLAKEVLALGIRPHVVLEQAVEKQSADTMGALEAHKKSLEYTKNVFAAFGG